MVHVDGPVGLDRREVASMMSERSTDAGIVLDGDAGAAAGDRGAGRCRPSTSASGRARRTRARKVMTLISAMALGADCIDDCDVLRAGPDRPGARPPGDGAVDARHVPARVHVRARPPARSGARPRRSSARGRRAPAGRRALVVDVDSLRRRGPRPRQAGRRVRLHPRARLSPDPRHARGHRRGAAHPPAHGLGEHAARDRCASSRADRARRAGRRDRRQAAARRLGVLEQEGRSTACERAGLAVLDRRPPATGRPARRSTQIDENAWQTLEDYPDDERSRRSPRRRSAGRRLVVRRVRTLERQGRAAARLGAVPVHDQPHRATRASSKPSTASTPSSSSPSATSKTRRSRTSPPATSPPTPPGR